MATRKAKKTYRALNPKTEESARAKLIYAALELFGEYGLDGASVRSIAKKAGQNIGAISYYFGDKQGLYTAVTEEIAAHLHNKLGSQQEEIAATLSRRALSQEECLFYLKKLITGAVMALVQQDKHSRSMSQVFSREQFAPTHALRLLYDNVHAPLHRLCCRLVGNYLGKNPESTEIIVRVYALIGSAMVFRMAYEMVRLRTGWKKIGEKELTMIADIVSEHVELILRGLHEKHA